MAGKKAAKKVSAKKTPAKKMAAKHVEHGVERDLRRAYEHMGRLEALRPLLEADAAEEIQALLRFGEGSLTAGDARSAADLLRAGEHLAFGSLAADREDGGAEERVRTAAEDECTHLLERAADHWEQHSSERGWPLNTIYKQARARADAALRKGALRRALEFARAAEALGHVHGVPMALPAGAGMDKLRG